jgi:hypothetical protein
MWCVACAGAPVWGALVGLCEDHREHEARCCPTCGAEG